MLTYDAVYCRIQLRPPLGEREFRWCCQEYSGDGSGTIYAYRDVITGRRFPPSCVDEIREGRVQIQAVEITE
jgi:hypothetical protein